MKRALVAVLCAAAGASAAQLKIQNPQATGFNDTTPAAPVGLNFGTTKGAQAVIAFQYAAAVWGAILNTPVPIVIDAAFVTTAQDSNMTCGPTSGLLGYTHPVNLVTAANFPNPHAGYVVALANALDGQDLTPGQAHILTRFNAGIGGSNCLAGASWYYGLDGATFPGQVSLLTTLLHEFSHGLGFSSFVDPTSGTVANVPAIFDFHVFDENAQTNWAGYTPAQRQPLLTAQNQLSFDGQSMTANLTTYLSNAPVLQFSGGGPTTQSDFATGQFSGPIPDGGSPQPVLAATPLDACADLPPGSLDGGFGLIERGTCTFYDKASRAAAAGAAGVIVFDNDAGPLVTMASPDGGVPLDVPAVFITNQDGNGVLQRLGSAPVSATFGASSHLSNTDASQSRVLLYTPPTVSSGSTLSHWNSGSFPKTLLMEPFIGASTRLDLDLTPNALADLGWPTFGGLSVGMTKAEDATLNDGAQATYLIAVINRRNAPVDGVQLALQLPAGATVVSASGGCQAMPCALGTMAALELRPVIVTVQAPSPTVYPFNATAQLSAPATSPDDNLAATVSTVKVTSGTGGGCSVGGVPAAVVLLLVAMAGLRARRRFQRG
jgi:uncharacterized repeat protein (TIGR01451 family)